MADRPGWFSTFLGYIGLGAAARDNQRRAAAMTSQTYSLTDPALVRALSSVSSTGKAVNDDSALRNSTGWSCRRILAETIGSIPWGLYEKDRAGNATPADDHWLSDVLFDSPNGDMTDVEFREAMVMNLTGDGNACALKETAGNRVTSLTPVEHEQIKVMQKLPGVSTTLTGLADGAVFFRYNDRGKPVDLPREKVFHVKGFSKNGLVGLSPIAHMREAMGMALATEEFGARFFSQGGMPSGTVTVPNWLTEDQRKIARENLNNLLGGMGNAHRFALLEGGMKPEAWEPMALEDMQFLVLRKFSVLEICRFYRVPPHMVADLERATFSNIEHLSTEFVQYTLLPYFTRFEAAVKKWLLPPAERKRYTLKFNPNGLLRGDTAARGAFYAQMLQNGVFNRNEVRALENQNRVEGLDGYTVQTNMTPVNRLDDIVDSQVEGNTQPAAATTDAVGKALQVQGGDTNVHFQLPEKISHGVHHTVEGVKEQTNATLALAKSVAAAQREMADQINEGHGALAHAFGSLAARQEQADERQQQAFERLEKKLTAGLEAIANQEHELVLDANGDPIGRKPKQPARLTH